MRYFQILAMVLVTSFVSLSRIHAAPTSTLKLEMRRDEYVARLKIETSRRFCAEDGMLRCFDVSTDRCKSLIEHEFSKCLSSAKVPEPVPLTGKDVQIAESVGACLGKKMAKTFEKQFKNTGDCAERK